jgi:hypothetical protein
VSSQICSYFIVTLSRRGSARDPPLEVPRSQTLEFTTSLPPCIVQRPQVSDHRPVAFHRGFQAQHKVRRRPGMATATHPSMSKMLQPLVPEETGEEVRTAALAVVHSCERCHHTLPSHINVARLDMFVASPILEIIGVIGSQDAEFGQEHPLKACHSTRQRLRASLCATRRMAQCLQHLSMKPVRYGETLWSVRARVLR